jgi:hypothetical protein
MTMNDLTNLFVDIPDELPEEFIRAILSTPDLRIERMVSLGHTSPGASGTTRIRTNGSCS